MTLESVKLYFGRWLFALETFFIAANLLLCGFGYIDVFGPLMIIRDQYRSNQEFCDPDMIAWSIVNALFIIISGCWLATKSSIIYHSRHTKIYYHPLILVVDACLISVVIILLLTGQLLIDQAITCQTSHDSNDKNLYTSIETSLVMYYSSCFFVPIVSLFTSLMWHISAQRSLQVERHYDSQQFADFQHINYNDCQDQPYLDTKCTICLNEYEATDCLLFLPCQHSFHVACIETWVQHNNKCPLCFAVVFVQDHTLSLEPDRVQDLERSLEYDRVPDLERAIEYDRVQDLERSRDQELDLPL